MRRFMILIALLALIATACSGTAGTAATVDGEDIATSDVTAMFPGDPDSFEDPQAFSSMLFNLIADQVIVASADDQFGLTVDQEAFDEQREVLVSQLTAPDETGVAPTLDEALAAANATEALLDAVVAQQVLYPQIQDALLEEAGPPTEAEIEAEFEVQSGALTEVCASHILLDSEEDAQATLDRALEGEDFADLAIELSTGPSGPDGGDLGCTSPGSYVPEFGVATMAAEIGVPTGPVETEFGFHVILVTDRTEPVLEDERDALLVSIENRRRVEVFDEWRTAELTAADVEVVEEYGTWTTEPIPAVLPPAN